MAVTRLISSHTHILYLSNLRWASYLLGDGEVVVLIFSLWPYRTPWHNALPNVSIRWIFAELICKIIGIHIPGLSHREPFPLLNIHNPCPQILGVVMHSEMKQLEYSAKRFSFLRDFGHRLLPYSKEYSVRIYCPCECINWKADLQQNWLNHAGTQSCTDKWVLIARHLLSLLVQMGIFRVHNELNVLNA